MRIRGGFVTLAHTRHIPNSVRSEFVKPVRGGFFAPVGPIHSGEKLQPEAPSLASPYTPLHPLRMEWSNFFFLNFFLSFCFFHFPISFMSTFVPT